MEGVNSYCLFVFGYTQLALDNSVGEVRVPITKFGQLSFFGLIGFLPLEGFLVSLARSLRTPP